MKIAITSTNDNENSIFDQRFGRSAWFCILNEDDGDVKFYKNEYAEASGGAGTKAAEKMAQLNVGKVISGDFGPKAKDLLEKMHIQMVIMNTSELTVFDIIQKLQQNNQKVQF